MTKVNYFAVIVAVVATFIVSSLWYSPLLFGKPFMELSGIVSNGSPNPIKIVGELLRTFILAYVLAHLATLLKIVSWHSALSLGIWLWIGFPVILLSGSIMWQNVPWQLAAIHAGDWLQKILIIMLILGMWRKSSPALLSS